MFSNFGSISSGKSNVLHCGLYCIIKGVLTDIPISVSISATSTLHLEYLEYACENFYILKYIYILHYILYITLRKIERTRESEEEPIFS